MMYFIVILIYYKKIKIYSAFCIIFKDINFLFKILIYVISLTLKISEIDFLKMN